MIRFFLHCTFFIVFFINICNIFAWSVERNNPYVSFLMNMKTLRADFVQKQYTEKGVIEASGRILVKKPDSILLEHNGNDMQLKFSSINGNVKMLDSEIGQTTYFDNQYSELIQFFTDNLKPEKLVLKFDKNICLPFNHLKQNFLACLYINLKSNLLSKLSLYTIIENNNNKKKKADEKVYKVFDVFFKNVEINGYINDNEFVLKDSRIFNDDEDEM